MGVAKKRRYDNATRIAAAQHTRERILEAAVEVFLERGYDELTIASVAERAGVSPQTVVLHFRTKDGLVEAGATWYRPREEQARELASADPLEAARVICARYDVIGVPSLRMLAIEDRVPGVRPLVEEGRASHRAWVERTFGSKLGSGAARARRIMALVVAYDVYTWEVLRRALSPEDTIQTMAELARGVLERGGRR